MERAIEAKRAGEKRRYNLKKNEDTINMFFDFKKKIALTHENCTYPRGRISQKSERSGMCAWLDCRNPERTYREQVNQERKDRELDTTLPGRD